MYEQDMKIIESAQNGNKEDNEEFSDYISSVNQANSTNATIIRGDE